MTKEQLAIRLNKMKIEAEQEIVKFQAKLEKDQAYAFSWADSAMHAAANLHVCNLILPCLEQDDVSIESVRKFAFDRVLHSARHPAASNSEVANAMDRKIGVAWARIIEMLN